MKFKMSRMSLNKMYLSYIRPILEYADVLWDGCSNENESRIEKVQLEAARLISGPGLTRSTSTNRNYQEIGWKTLHRRRKEKKLILFHKIVHNIAPSYLRDLLPLTVGQNTHYHLRNQMNFIEPRCRLDLYRKSFFPSTINMWNSLPQSLREITNLNSFKRSITERTISVPRFYFNGERKYAILHARLMPGLHLQRIRRKSAIQKIYDGRGNFNDGCVASGARLLRRLRCSTLTT